MPNINTILPPQTVGIIGGGQLGRMMAISAKYMGYNVAVLDPTPNCPTAQVADEHIIANYNDLDAIKQLTEKSDVVTYEFENVDLEAATYIEERGKLPQGAYALEVTQNREKEKTVIKEAGLPVPDFAIVKDGEQCRTSLKDFTLPAVIKTCRGGYDGKGQFKIETENDIEEAVQFAEQDGTFIIEQWITFDKEISVIFTRTQQGKISVFPVGENDHKDHILYETIVPARINEGIEQKAIDAATVLAEKMNIVGTFAIEMFVKENDIYINEMAPRPHNSGHYSIEGCNLSQFDSHIRAVCGLPIPKIELLQPSLMINILGEDMVKALHALTHVPEGFVHLYGKEEAKEKRKMGHITFIAETENKLKSLKVAYERNEA